MVFNDWKDPQMSGVLRFSNIKSISIVYCDQNGIVGGK
jgi:hypothetical protein